MGELWSTVTPMTDDDISPTDHIFYGVSALRGWDEVIDRARSLAGPQAAHVGSFFSSLILAGGESEKPFAISGELDGSGDGDVVLFYRNHVVVGHAWHFTADGGEVAVTALPFSAIHRVQVRADHNYFGGTGARPRHRGVTLIIPISDRVVTLTGRMHASSPLVGDDALLQVLDAIRSRWAEGAVVS